MTDFEVVTEERVEVHEAAASVQAVVVVYVVAFRREIALFRFGLGLVGASIAMKVETFAVVEAERSLVTELDVVGTAFAVKAVVVVVVAVLVTMVVAVAFQMSVVVPGLVLEVPLVVEG